MKKLLALTTALLVAACASAPSDNNDPFENRDPMRPLNEAIFNFNLGADKFLIRPIAKGYHELPSWMRDSTSNFFSNLGEPLTGVNNLLQGNFQAFGTTLFRFVLNSTLGFAGLRDFAGENGLIENDQGFNDTLRFYGAGTGYYVVIPILGPSSTRGSVGRVADWFADPVGYYESLPVSIGQGVSEGIIAREENDAIVEQLYYKSLDPYTAARATYLQHQAAKEKGADTGSPYEFNDK